MEAQNLPPRVRETAHEESEFRSSAMDSAHVRNNNLPELASKANILAWIGLLAALNRCAESFDFCCLTRLTRIVTVLKLRIIVYKKFCNSSSIKLRAHWSRTETSVFGGRAMKNCEQLFGFVVFARLFLRH